MAADANLSGDMYPDLSLYPSNSVPNVVRNINKALARADQIHNAEGKNPIDWYVPIVADAEAGFGGVLNAYELMVNIVYNLIELKIQSQKERNSYIRFS